MDIITLALAKKFAKEYTDTHASKLTEEDAIQAVANYFNENPNAIVTNDELTEILDNYSKGLQGPPGHTPEYGVDYGTPGQIEDIANQAAGILQPDVNQLKQDVAAITPDDTTVNGKPWTSKKIVDSLCQPIEESGNPVQCYPVENYPLGVKVQMEPVQEGSGDPSPQNVRPITGRDKVSVTRCGKNLVCSKYDPGYTETKNGLTFTVNDDYSVSVSGTATIETYFNFKTIGLKTINTIINAMDKTVKINGYTARDLVVQTYPSGFTGLYLVITKGKTVDRTYYPILVYGDEIAYEPYRGNTYDIALPETVYGGTLDVETGVVTVEYGHIASYAGEALPGEWISDRDVYSAGAVPTTGAQVVYKLAEPLTIRLTPQQITALSGANTIHTDADGLVITGAEDPKHTITELKNAIISLGGNI